MHRNPGSNAICATSSLGRERKKKLLKYRDKKNKKTTTGQNEATAAQVTDFFELNEPEKKEGKG